LSHLLDHFRIQFSRQTKCKINLDLERNSERKCVEKEGDGFEGISKVVERITSWAVVRRSIVSQKNNEWKIAPRQCVWSKE
jgi:hypothetical protein